jgi:hypothetical protein
MNHRPLDRAQELARHLSRALGPLRCRGHAVSVPGCDPPSFREARRFVEMTLWMPWRVPHVMLVPCVLPGDRPAVLVGTWDPRGVAIRQTVTSTAAFEAEVAAAAATLGERASADDLATMRSQHEDGGDAPDLENLEFWPEVLSRLQGDRATAEQPDDPGVPVAAAIAERIWPARLEDLRELQRALDD